MTKELLQNDLENIMKEFINRNKNLLTDLIIDSFNSSLTDMAKEQISNAITYYRSEASRDLDLSLSKRLASSVKDLFNEELKTQAEKTILDKINNIKITLDEKIDEIMERDLRVFLRNEIKLRVREMINDKELRITI